MKSWKLPVNDITEPGRLYILNPDEPPEAFVVQTEFDIPGAYKIADNVYLVAFSNVCTHMGCHLYSNSGNNNVHYGKEEKQLSSSPCPCHGSSFDLVKGGLVILGPATQNLPQLKLKIDGENIVTDGYINNPDPQFENWPTEENVNGGD